MLQNEKYIKFAAEACIDVISVSGVPQAVAQGRDRAETFQKPGSDEKWLVNWPSLTVEDMKALNASKVPRYNDTRGIPFTCIVDPHTEERMTVIKGRSVGAFQEDIANAYKALRQKYGPGFPRKKYRSWQKSLEKTDYLVGKGEFSKALREVKKASKGHDKWPEGLKKQRQQAMDGVVAAGEKALEEALNLKGSERKRALSRLRVKLRGTPLQERAQEEFKKY